MSKKRIEEIDSNFKSVSIEGVELSFYDPTKKPFSVHGLGWFEKEHKYCRMPEALLPKLNEGVQGLAWNPSGARICFCTDSSKIVIKAEVACSIGMGHMPRSGSAGFDLYENIGDKSVFRGNAFPAVNANDIEKFLLNGNEKNMREWTVYLPLYNSVTDFSIGLDPDAIIEGPAPFSIEKTVLYYGSSITQGGCSSRPGNAYPAIISRWLDCDFINLGFSGSARGELEMARAIAELDISALVLDYDHNAPDVGHLEKTHEPFFEEIRRLRPELPVIMVSKPDFDLYPDINSTRREIIRRTYNNASGKGDSNVFFIDGETLFGKADRDACTVDGCHPNDIGFIRMAENIVPVVKEALKL